MTQKPWSKEDQDRLIEGLRLHGKDSMRLHEHIPHKTKLSIQKQYSLLKTKLLKKIDFEHADVLEILNETTDRHVKWTERE